MSRRDRARLALALGVLLLPLGCATTGPPRAFDHEPQALARRSAPILLVHGVLISARVVPGFNTFDPQIVDALRAEGFDVWLPALPAIAPPEERVADLARAIDEVRARTGAARVHVIAHSMAGIDVRLLLADAIAADKVVTVVTLSSPHAGTPLAEVGRRLLGSLAASFMNRGARRIAESRRWPGVEGHLRGLVAALSPQSMAAFNLAHPTPRVPLYSLATSPEPANDGACDGGAWPAPSRATPRHLFMSIGGQLIDEVVGRHQSNDGMVPSASGRFGSFLGCAPIDHMGWLRGRVDGGFDTPAFFVELARGLRDVERTGDPTSMLAHAAVLGRIAQGAAR